VADCHHLACCGCQREATYVLEAYGADGVSRFELCDFHLGMAVAEANDKGYRRINVSLVS